MCENEEKTHFLQTDTAVHQGTQLGGQSRSQVLGLVHFEVDALVQGMPDQPHVAALILLLHTGVRPTCAMHSLACLATMRCDQMGPWQGT